MYLLCSLKSRQFIEKSIERNNYLEFNSPHFFDCELDSIGGACSTETHELHRLHRVGANYKRWYIHHPLKGHRFLPTVLQSSLSLSSSRNECFFSIFATILPWTQLVAIETFQAVTFRTLSGGEGFLTRENKWSTIQTIFVNWTSPRSSFFRRGKVRHARNAMDPL